MPVVSSQRILNGVLAWSIVKVPAAVIAVVLDVLKTLREFPEDALPFIVVVPVVKVKPLALELTITAPSV